MINAPLAAAFRNREVAPNYTDPAHPIYRALPIADALDALDRRYTASDMSDAALSVEALLIDAGEAAGGSSTEGFRADLIRHVQDGERAEDEAAFEARGVWRFYDRNCEPCFAAHKHGRALAEQWIADVAAALARHGMAFDGGGIVSAAPVTRAAYARQGVALAGVGA